MWNLRSCSPLDRWRSPFLYEKVRLILNKKLFSKTNFEVGEKKALVTLYSCSTAIGQRTDALYLHNYSQVHFVVRNFRLMNVTRRSWFCLAARYPSTLNSQWLLWWSSFPSQEQICHIRRELLSGIAGLQVNAVTLGTIWVIVRKKRRYCKSIHYGLSKIWVAETASQIRCPH